MRMVALVFSLCAAASSAFAAGGAPRLHTNVHGGSHPVHRSAGGARAGAAFRPAQPPTFSPHSGLTLPRSAVLRDGAATADVGASQPTSMNLSGQAATTGLLGVHKALTASDQKEVTTVTGQLTQAARQIAQEPANTTVHTDALFDFKKPAAEGVDGEPQSGPITLGSIKPLVYRMTNPDGEQSAAAGGAHELRRVTVENAPRIFDSMRQVVGLRLVSDPASLKITITEVSPEKTRKQLKELVPALSSYRVEFESAKPGTDAAARRVLGKNAGVLLGAPGVAGIELTREGLIQVEMEDAVDFARTRAEFQARGAGLSQVSLHVWSAAAVSSGGVSKEVYRLQPHGSLPQDFSFLPAVALAGLPAALATMNRGTGAGLLLNMGWLAVLGLALVRALE